MSHKAQYAGTQGEPPQACNLTRIRALPPVGRLALRPVFVYPQRGQKSFLLSGQVT